LIDIPAGGRLDARVISLWKKITVVKSKEMETGLSNSQEWTNLAESFKEDYGSKRAVLPVMMMNDEY
jgi:hypothetical protein